MPDRYARSRAQHARASGSLAGGVATAFRAPQLPVPISFAGARGSHLTDVDGHRYVDFALAFGPMLLGHSPEPVIEAVRRQVGIGLGYGASHAAEAELAEAICRMVPGAERCVFSSTGSEAVHAAIRIARAATGRNRVVKFLGHFHGWLDPLSVGVPGLADASPASAGQDPNASSATTVCPWNDIDALATALDRHDVAAVIMEPLAVNGGCFSPAPGYLEAVRRLTARTGTVLIFDEVITGFRLAPGGAQERFGVTADLAIFAKALGSGFPISAVVGRADLMDEVATRRVRHAGTLNANPISVAASLAALATLERDADLIYPQLETMGNGLAAILREECGAAGLPVRVNQVGAMGFAFWSEAAVDDYPTSLGTDFESYRRWARALLDEGVHVISRGLLYVSTAHTQADLDEARQGIRRAATVARAGLDQVIAAGIHDR